IGVLAENAAAIDRGEAKTFLPSGERIISWVEAGMSISPVLASVAASKNCTLLAVFAVTIRCGPPGGLLRSGIAIILHREQRVRLRSPPAGRGPARGRSRRSPRRPAGWVPAHRPRSTRRTRAGLPRRGRSATAARRARHRCRRGRRLRDRALLRTPGRCSAPPTDAQDGRPRAAPPYA